MLLPSPGACAGISQNVGDLVELPLAHCPTVPATGSAPPLAGLATRAARIQRRDDVRRPKAKPPTADPEQSSSSADRHRHDEARSKVVHLVTAGVRTVDESPRATSVPTRPALRGDEPPTTCCGWTRTRSVSDFADESGERRLGCCSAPSTASSNATDGTYCSALWLLGAGRHDRDPSAESHDLDPSANSKTFGARQRDRRLDDLPVASV